MSKEIKPRFQTAIVNAYRQDDEFKNLLKRQGPPEIDLSKINQEKNIEDFVWNVIDWAESGGEPIFKKLVKITCEFKPSNQDLQNIGKELFPELFSEVSGNKTPLNGSNNDSVREYSSQQKLKVFLCHASADKNVVRGLFNRLDIEHDKGCKEFQVWFDEHDLFAGDDINEEITEGVDKSDAFVVCVSKMFFEGYSYSQGRFTEIKTAIQKKFSNKEDSKFFKIIPVILDEPQALPESIGVYKIINYYQNQEKGYKDLYKALKKLKEQKKT